MIFLPFASYKDSQKYIPPLIIVLRWSARIRLSVHMNISWSEEWLWFFNSQIAAFRMIGSIRKSFINIVQKNCFFVHTNNFWSLLIISFLCQIAVFTMSSSIRKSFINIVQKNCFFFIHTKTFWSLLIIFFLLISVFNKSFMKKFFGKLFVHT